MTTGKSIQRRLVCGCGGVGCSACHDRGEAVLHVEHFQSEIDDQWYPAFPNDNLDPVPADEFERVWERDEVWE